MIRFLPVMVACALAALPLRADEKADFFEARIRPVLVEQCQSCHGTEAAGKNKLKGGLLLDTRDGLLKGGDTGPAVVPGKPKESLLLKTLHYDGDVQMPPKGKLPAAVVKDFETWIADGAFDPRTADGPAKKGIDLAKGREFWAFQPPKDHAPAAGPFLDGFIQAQWKEKGLTPAPAADKRTLIRRVTFDLTGLPPTAQAVEAFERDTSPNAFAKVIDRLLASPQYGERYARMWLDVARYAEDQAHTFAVKPKKNAYRYRDWVIDAFNADMPFDRFALLQIAGDLLPDDGGDPFVRLGGMGFLGLGAEYYKNTAKEQAVADELDDRVDTLTRGFLGLTVSCARCHDHKFDPIPQVDYYSIAGIFHGSNLTESFLAPKEEVKAYQEAVAKQKAMDDKLKKMQAEAKKTPKDDTLSDGVKALQGELAKLTREMPKPPPSVHILSGGGAGMKVYVRGNPLTPGPAAPKGFLQVMSESGLKPADYTRLDLAKAVASKDNPLTARVIVNRVWQAHFGRGLVGTPSNFGALGDRPTHPELLDTLAAKFMAHGWSLKWLHREILTSSTYQLSSNAESGARSAEPKPVSSTPHSELRAPNSIDPGNQYLWRADRRRLDVEAWRDSLLSVAGTLDDTMGGPTFDLKDPKARRRTVYARISRHELDGLLRLFDFPDANVTADKRTETTVPQQQLFALNSDFMAAQARAFADRIARAPGGDPEMIAFAYRSAFQREPTPREAELGLKFLKVKAAPAEKLTRWQQYAQVLLASNEAMYVD